MRLLPIHPSRCCAPDGVYNRTCVVGRAFGDNIPEWVIRWIAHCQAKEV